MKNKETTEQALKRAMTLKQGNTYIIKGNNVGNDKQVCKITVLELTETSIFYKNVDSGKYVRDMLEEFNYRYKIIEDLGGEIRNDKELFINIL